MADVPFGLALRRARLASGFSQRELAAAAEISQPMISHYEHARAVPREDVRQRLEELLHTTLPAAELPKEQAPSPERDVNAVERCRQELLRSVRRSPSTMALHDHPAGVTGGDLAVWLRTRSHDYLIVIDGVGSGYGGACSALLATGIATGLALSAGGIAWPQEIIETCLRSETEFGIDRRPALFVAQVDRRSRRLSIATRAFPPAVLRNAGRVVSLGNDPARTHSEIPLADGALLLVATDGVTGRATRGGRTLWASDVPAELLNKLATPEEVILELQRRLSSQHAVVSDDDELAVAWSP